MVLANWRLDLAFMASGTNFQDGINSFYVQRDAIVNSNLSKQYHIKYILYNVYMYNEHVVIRDFVMIF